MEVDLSRRESDITELLSFHTNKIKISAIQERAITMYLRHVISPKKLFKEKDFMNSNRQSMDAEYFLHGNN